MRSAKPAQMHAAASRVLFRGSGGQLLPAASGDSPAIDQAWAAIDQTAAAARQQVEVSATSAFEKLCSPRHFNSTLSTFTTLSHFIKNGQLHRRSTFGKL
jgi:hypothetical protein